VKTRKILTGRRHNSQWCANKKKSYRKAS